MFVIVVPMRYLFLDLMCYGSGEEMLLFELVGQGQHAAFCKQMCLFLLAAAVYSLVCQVHKAACGLTVEKLFSCSFPFEYLVRVSKLCFLLQEDPVPL